MQRRGNKRQGRNQQPQNTIPSPKSQGKLNIDCCFDKDAVLARGVHASGSGTGIRTGKKPTAAHLTVLLHVCFVRFLGPTVLVG